MIRYIKHLFIVWLVSFLIFLWSVNADFSPLTVLRNWVMYDWVGGSQYQVAGNWNLLSQYGAATRRMLAFNVSNYTKAYFFWNESWLPYMYYYYYNDSVMIQWQYQYYWLCDELLSWSSSAVNCSKSPINSSFVESVIPIFNSMKSTDYFWYYYWYYTSYSRHYYLLTCFSSSYYWKSICFNSDDWVTNTLNLDVNVSMSDIPASIMSFSPWWSYIEWWSNTSDNTVLTWNVTYNVACTNWFIVSKLSSLYWWTNVCYAWTYDTWTIRITLINNSITYVPSEKWLDFKEVYSWSKDIEYFSSYANWFNTWNDRMYRFKMWTLDLNIFNSQPVYLYAYFLRLYDNWLVYQWQNEVYNLLNFCKLALYSDYDKPYEWQYFQDYCNTTNFITTPWSNVTTWQVWDVENDNDLEVLPPNYDVWWNNNWWSYTSSWTIISVDWSGTLSGDINKNFEWKTFINDFYQKLQSSYQKPLNNVSWIIPNYILAFMFALILFRFLQH